MGTLYWAIVVLMFGGCIGSFLNVVIYRWSRDLSVSVPKRSFCPRCESAIAWYDNLPVISYLLLRARCRNCKLPISLQYPLVELATALVFLMTYDTFFVAQTRDGVFWLSSDTALLIAHLILWSGMIVLTVMDLEAYMIDIRVTWIVSAAGLVMHTLWRPTLNVMQAERNWLWPSPTLAVVSIAILMGMAFSWLMLRKALAQLPEEEHDHADEPEPPTSDPKPVNWPLLLIPVALVVGYVVWMTTSNASISHLNGGAFRLGVGTIGLLIGMTLLAARPDTEVDEEMDDILDAEAPAARKMALDELRFLFPALVLGLAAFGLMQVESIATLAETCLYASVGHGYHPVLGLSTAITGWIVAGGIGWSTRIIFTLLFGKEAFGLGDIHILAAAGAVAGWPIAFLGFFLAALLALTAILLMALLPVGGKWPVSNWLVGAIICVLCYGVAGTYPLLIPVILMAAVLVVVRQRRQAMPYGPWLALGFFVAFIYQDILLNLLQLRWMLE